MVQLFHMQGTLLDLLDEQVPLIFGGLAILGPYDACGPVEVQHVDQLLLLVFQFFNLCLQLRVH